jgi:Mn-dependent DtxR family transcriptional regulator
MLEDLLQTLQRGGTHTLAELARGLGASESLVEMMLEELARLGYLAPVDQNCSLQCGGCPIPATCTVGGGSRVWTLTGKS